MSLVKAKKVLRRLVRNHRSMIREGRCSSDCVPEMEEEIEAIKTVIGWLGDSK